MMIFNKCFSAADWYLFLAQVTAIQESPKAESRSKTVVRSRIEELKGESAIIR